MPEDMRNAFFLLVDSKPVDPLVSWAKDEIVRLEGLLAERARKKGAPPPPSETSKPEVPKV